MDIREEDGKINIPNDLCEVVRNLISLSEEIYPNLNTLHIKILKRFKEKAIRIPKNDTVVNFNDSFIRPTSYRDSEISICGLCGEVRRRVNYPVKSLHTLNPPEIQFTISI